MTVHQHIPHGPFLGHIHQSAVNGAVSVGMIFTHGITDDTGALSVGLVRTIIQFRHGIQNPPLYRL